MKKCSRCGKATEIVFKVIVDFYPKEIVLCKNCIKETLLYDTTKYTKAGVELLSAHIDYAEETQTQSSKNFVKDNIEILSIMPLAVQSVLFKQDEFSKKRILNDLKNRQLYFLKQKLSNAVKKENYRLAKKLKEKIDKLDNLSEI